MVFISLFTNVFPFILTAYRRRRHSIITYKNKFRSYAKIYGVVENYWTTVFSRIFLVHFVRIVVCVYTELVANNKKYKIKFYRVKLGDAPPYAACIARVSQIGDAVTITGILQTSNTSYSNAGLQENGSVDNRHDKLYRFCVYYYSLLDALHERIVNINKVTTN